MDPEPDVISDILSERTDHIPSFPYTKDEVDFPVHHKTSESGLPPLTRSTLVHYAGRRNSDKVIDDDPATFRDDESMFTTVSSVFPETRDVLNTGHGSDVIDSVESVQKGIATIKDIDTTVQSNGYREKAPNPIQSEKEPDHNQREQSANFAKHDKFQPQTSIGPKSSGIHNGMSKSRMTEDIPSLSVESMEEAKFEYEEAKPAVTMPNHLKVELSLNLMSSADTTTSATDTPDMQPKQIKYLAFGSSSQNQQKEPKKEANKLKHKRKHRPKQRPTDSSEDIQFEYAEDDTQRKSLPPALSCELSLNLRDSMDSENQGPSRPPAAPAIPERRESPSPEPEVADVPEEVPVEVEPEPEQDDSGEAAVISTDYQEFVQRLMSDSRFQNNDAPKPSHGLPRPSKTRGRPKSAGNMRKSQTPDPGRESVEAEPYRQKWASSSHMHLTQSAVRQSKSGRPRPSSAKVSRASVNFEDGASDGVDRNTRTSTSMRGRPSSAERRYDYFT